MVFRRRRSLLTAGAGVVGAVAGIVALGLYGASQVVSPRRAEIQGFPDAMGLPIEKLQLRSRDGLRLSAALMRAPGAQASVILLHGHGASKEMTLPVAAMLFPQFNVLALDLRAHGESEGRVTSVGYLERLDVIAAAEELTRRVTGPIGVVGVSMGASAAIFAAVESPLLRAVVADSGFATLRGVIARAAHLRGYPRPLTPFLAELTCRTIAYRQRYPVSAPDPARVVSQIAPRPLLVVHGERDTLCPVAEAQRLYASAGEPRELWVVPDQEHATAYHSVADEYGARLNAFFRRWLGDDARNGPDESSARP
jgi:uncharacterized protein